jgi:hypothetical protein
MIILLVLYLFKYLVLVGVASNTNMMYTLSFLQQSTMNEDDKYLVLVLLYLLVLIPGTTWKDFGFILQKWLNLNNTVRILYILYIYI